MIDLKIDSVGGRAYVKVDDLEEGKEIIYFGESGPFECDIAKTDESIEKNLEGILTHESCHIIVYQLTNSLRCTTGIDNMDNSWKGWPISGSFYRGL